MPVFNLGSLGRFKLKRKKLENEEMPPKPADKRSHGRRHSSPPPYSMDQVPISPTTESASSQETLEQKSARFLQLCRPPETKEPTTPKEQLQRYIIEAIALTFSADFDELNDALHEIETTKGTNSNLTRKEREELLKLSGLVLKLHGQIEACEINSIHLIEEEEVQAAIILPSMQLHRFGISEFYLDLIAWYGLRLSYPTPWSDTLPGYWASNPHNRPEWGNSKNDLPDSFSTFLFAIQQASPNETVRRVLDNALDDCRRRCGVKSLKSVIIARPLRTGYWQLFKALDGVR